VSSWKRTYTSFARFAFADALDICGVRFGDSVLVPAFICRDILAPIRERSAEVVFYDVDKTLKPIVTSQMQEARAILAVNYFGFSQYLDDLRELASGTGAVIIEDNAHGYLSRTEFGVDLGKRTGIGFTSFRKTVRVFNGAYLDVDLDQFPKANAHGSDRHSVDTSPLPAGFRLRNLASSVERTTGLHLMNSGRSIVRTVRKMSGRPPIPASHESETSLPPSRVIHSTALTTLNSMDENTERERRRLLFAQVSQEIRGCGHDLVFDVLPNGTVPWCVPFYAHPNDTTRLRRRLKTLGLEVFLWPDLPDAVRGRCPEHYSQVHAVGMML
jgi:hypothetical protein